MYKAYGTLLKRWDKRESTGEEYLARADSILAQLPAFAYGLRLNQMVQLPEASV
jgi:hypothetical protein